MTQKTLLPQLAVCLLFFAFLFIQSCDDDDPKDTQSPNVNFSNLTDGSTVWNTVSVEVEAIDNAGIASIDLYVDNSLVSTDTEEPFAFSWDSNTVADGDHIVKVVVADKSGNTVETQLTVKVLNTLVTFPVRADQLNTDVGYAERGFVFLSDSDGKVIAFQEYQNGNTITLKSSTFNGEKFYLTEVLHEENDTDNDHVRAWTYASIERGKNWVLLDDRDDEDESYVGEASFTYTNANVNFNYFGTTNGEDVWYEEFSQSTTAQLRKSPSPLYMVRHPLDDGGAAPPAEPTYNLYNGIVVGNNTVNLALVTKSLTKVMMDFPDDVLYSSVEMKGYQVANVFTDPVRIGYFGSSNDQYPVYYPGAALPTYYTEIYYETPKIYYGRATTSTALTLPTITNDVKFSFANGKLSYTATGAFDALSTQVEKEDESGAWSLILPASATSTTLPSFEVPQVIQSFGLPSFTLPSHFTIYDFEGISNYDDLKQFIRNSSYSIDELYAEGKNVVDIIYFSASTNGRFKRPEKYSRTFGKRQKR